MTLVKKFLCEGDQLIDPLSSILTVALRKLDLFGAISHDKLKKPLAREV